MKKFLVVLLVIIMVLPLGMVASAEEDVGIKPFYFVQFQQQVPEYYELSDLYYYSPPFYTGAHSLASYIVDYEGAKDIPSVAEKLKGVFNSQPEGTRYVTFQLPHTALHNLSENVIYIDNATEVTKKWFEEFIAEYHRIGGKVDGFILDLEYQSSEAHYIYYTEYSKDNTLFKRIVEHPQYKTKIRPLLEERGFKFYDDTNLLTEIWGITMTTGEYANCRAIWDVAIRNMINDEMTKAIYEPLVKYYPDAMVTDYQAKNTYNWHKTASDYGGTGINYGGNYQALGNSSNYNTYSVRPTLNYYTDLKTNIPTYNVPHTYYKAVYENTPFHMFLWESNIFKDLYAAKGDDQVSMWVCGYDYNKENENSASNTPYYAETILHMGMLNPQPLLGWITVDTYGGDEEAYQYALKVVDDIVVELTRVLGAADREPILVPSTWNDSFVLSGMYAGGKNIWRLTPDTTQVSKDNFKVEGKDPTFSVNGKTITFPQGKIIEDGKVTEVGTCGYWIETPKDVTPVVTTDSSSHYSDYPTFQEDFEVYEPGTEFNFNTSLPVYVWEFKKSKDSTATVVTDKNNPDNQGLALTGNFTVKNVRLPKNVTAGDTYAENQMWEITVTLPANMGTDAEVVLLNCFGQKKKSDDLGIKIAGGKLYYDKAGEYQELTGVDLSAGGTYTVRREVDFNNAEAFTSDYSILDATGKLLGEVKNVPMVSLELPMTSIHFGVANVTGDAVLVDNYRLYPTGVAADFELYDADLGLFVEDITKARAEDTAYRLSWLNAADKEKNYTVMVAYYDGETKVSEKVLQEVKMAPGTDGIETGIVKCEEGKSILVYLRNDSPEDGDDNGKPSTPGNKPGAAADSEGLSLIVVIVIILAVVVAVALLLVILATSTPKKKVKKVTKIAKPKDDTAE